MMDMEYVFFGNENYDMTPADPDYSEIGNVRDFYDILIGLWRKETCAPRMRDEWSEKNRTLGQCSITAFLFQDVFGGDVYGIPLGDGNYHCFNVLSGKIIDLTSEQFKDPLDYSVCEKQDRSLHFRKTEKKERYELLRSLLSDYLKKLRT